MQINRILVLLLGLVASSPTLAAEPSVAAMKWQRRILLTASPAAFDPKAIVQRRIFSEWKSGAAGRDVSLVEVSGAQVAGAADTAVALRKRYHLDATSFQALLIGKDGHVAMRSQDPISADVLEGAIDAMPMRRAGQR